MTKLRLRLLLLAIVSVGVPTVGNSASADPQMCLSQSGATPHKDKGLMCFKYNGVCTCHEADFGGGWPQTPITPGKPGWNEHEVNQRFIDDLNNELLTTKGKHRNVVKNDLRNFTNSLKSGLSLGKP